MQVSKQQTLPVRSDSDVVMVRQAVRTWSAEIGLGLVDQTKVVTAASELARNTLGHGGGGTCQMQIVQDATRRGLRLIFEDQGPGIPDINQALTDGFTTGTGLGLGLGGARRLVNEFELTSKLGQGTRVTIIKWK